MITFQNGLDGGKFASFGVNYEPPRHKNHGGILTDLDSIINNPVWQFDDEHNMDNGDFTDLSALGRDASSSIVFREDWQQIVRNIIVRTFRDQPKVLRRLAALGGNTLASALNGRGLFRIGSMSDIERPEYAMAPFETHTALSLTEIEGKLPQIFQTASQTLDDWARTAAGMDRWSLLNGEIVRKIQIEEDIIGFQGNTKENTDGLLSASASDLGDPTAAWGIDTNNNGRLDNMRTDVQGAIDAFTANGLGDRPIDVVMTSYIYTRIRTTELLNRAGDNLTWLQNVINGGEIFVTNNIQAPGTAVSATANSILFVARDPGNMQNWTIISSDMETRMKEGLWDVTYGLREKFAIKVLNADYVRWMDGISNATS